MISSPVVDGAGSVYVRRQHAGGALFAFNGSGLTGSRRGRSTRVPPYILSTPAISGVAGTLIVAYSNLA